MLESKASGEDLIYRFELLIKGNVKQDKSIMKYINMLAEAHRTHTVSSLLYGIKKGIHAALKVYKEENLIGLLLLGVTEYSLSGLRVCYLGYAADEFNPDIIEQGFPIVRKWAKERNCSLLEIHGRRGWLVVAEQLELDIIDKQILFYLEV